MPGEDDDVGDSSEASGSSDGSGEADGVPSAEQTLRKECGLSQTLFDDLKAHRLQITKAHLAGDFIERHAINSGGCASVNVLAIRKAFHKRRIASYILLRRGRR